MIDVESVIIEKEAKTYIHSFWPDQVFKKLDPEGFDSTNLLKLAAAEGKDTSEMHLSVNANYALCGFEKFGQKIKAVFRTDPLCWTDNPSDWWWKSQRDSESFKDLLRIATNTRETVWVELPGFKLISIPRWFSPTYQWRLIKK